MPVPARRGGDRRLDAALALGLALLVIAVYAQVRHHAFLDLDDGDYVTANEHVQQGLTRDGVRWALTGVHSATWHPLTSLSHMLDVHLFGMDAGAHLLVNAALHATTTVLLFGVLRWTTGRPCPSALVAALFGLHPAHVESVAWVAERKDVLSTVFWVLTLWAYAWWAGRGGRARYALVILAFTGGLLSKPMVVTLPIVLLLLDIWPLARLGSPPSWGAASRLLLEKVPLLALAATVGVVTVIVQRGVGAVIDAETLPLQPRISNALVSYVRYLGELLWPTRLAIFYPYRFWPAPLVLAAGVAVAGLSALAVAAGRRRPWILVGWGWYLVTLLPVIGLVQVWEQSMADRFTYVPAVGIFIIVAWAADELATRDRRARVAVWATSVAVVAALTVAAWVQVGYWRDDLTVFSRALAVTESNYLAHSQVAKDLVDDRRVDEAEPHFAEALHLYPGYPPALNGLGDVLASRGKLDEAEGYFRQAITARPTFSNAYNNLGWVLARKGDLQGAVAAFERALELRPRYAMARYNYGKVLADLGRREEAAAQYAEIVRTNPGATGALSDLAATLSALGRTDAAAEAYEALLRRRPSDARAAYELGNLRMEEGRFVEAEAAYRTALRARPDWAEADHALGRALEEQLRIPRPAREDAARR